jgi:CheY-like chemotaxis protein
VTALGEEAPGRAVAAEGGAVALDASGLHVLVADDNEINREIARLVLRRFGNDADFVGNGRDAVDRVVSAAASGSARPYDLVLMDVQMPELDGLEATRAIRQTQAEQPSLRWPRIVAMTANAMQEDRATCLAAGMDDYLTKPLSFEEVGRVLREATKRPAPGATGTTKTGGGIDAGTPAAGNGARSAKPGPGAVSGPSLLDWSRLEELAEYDTDDRAVVRGAIAALADQVPDLLDDIRRGVAGRDAGLLRNSAHRLKGAASNIGAVAVALRSGDLERAGREGSFDGLATLVEELSAVVRTTMGELTRYAGGETVEQEGKGQ